MDNISFNKQWTQYFAAIILHQAQINSCNYKRRVPYSKHDHGSIMSTAQLSEPVHVDKIYMSTLPSSCGQDNSLLGMNWRYPT